MVSDWTFAKAFRIVSVIAMESDKLTALPFVDETESKLEIISFNSFEDCSFSASPVAIESIIVAVKRFEIESEDVIESVTVFLAVNWRDTESEDGTESDSVL
jgi:hypothetical protein